MASWADGEGELPATAVAIRLETTNLAGVPIVETDPGSDFYLLAWVSDQRSDADPAGVYAAYLDVAYDALVSVVSDSDNDLGFDIEFGEAYQNGVSGNHATPGVLDEVGGFQTDFDPLGAGEVLLFRVRFSTGEVNLVDDRFEGVLEDSGTLLLDVLANDQVQSGTVQFTGNPADVHPLHDVVLYSPASNVPHDAIEFIPTELDILEAGLAIIDSVGIPSAGGSVWINTGGTSLVYEPAADFFGTETFTYTVAGDVAEVTVVVEPVEDVPVASDDAYGVVLDGLLVVDALQGVLANDHDSDGDSLIAHIVQQPTSGTVTLQEDGSFEYLPTSGFRGRDAFTYVADDGQSLSQEVTAWIDVGLPQMSVRLELTDGSGQEIGSVASGDALWLRVWVNDLRDENYTSRGVVAAYLDVLFDPQFLRPLVDAALPRGFEIAFGAEFSATGSGDVDSPGVINEVGSFAESLEPMGSGEVLLFEMPFDVVPVAGVEDQFEVSYQSDVNRFDVLQNDLELVWLTELAVESADESPGHDTLLFQSPTPVVDDQIIFSGASLELSNSPELTIVGASATVAGGVAQVSSNGKHVLYSPPSGFVGTDSFTYTVANPLGLLAEATVTVEVIPSWQNVHAPLDVNSDTYISPVDALFVIYELNHGGARVLVDPPTGPPFVDINNDGQLSPLDALIVIDFLSNGSNAEGELASDGEGESGFGALLASEHTGGVTLVLSEALTVTGPVTSLVAAGDVSSAPVSHATADTFPAATREQPVAESLPQGASPFDQLHQRWEGHRTSLRVEQAVEDLLEWLGEDDE